MLGCLKNVSFDCKGQEDGHSGRGQGRLGVGFRVRVRFRVTVGPGIRTRIKV